MGRFNVLLWIEEPYDGGCWNFDSSYDTLDLAEVRIEELESRGYQTKLKEEDYIEEL